MSFTVTTQDASLRLMMGSFRQEKDQGIILIYIVSYLESGAILDASRIAIET